MRRAFGFGAARHRLLVGGGGGVFYILSSTNATLTTAAGADPQVDLAFGADIFAGFYLRIQRSADGVQSGGNYVTPTLDIIHSVTETELAALAIPNADLTPDGYVSPAGAYWQRYRWEREDGAFGPWTEISGTVTASVNHFSGGGNGVDKSQYINVQASLLSIILNNNVGSQIMARALTPMPGKAHAEFTVDGWYSGATNGLLCGVCDSGAVTSFSTFGNQPGASNRPGVCFRIGKNANVLDVFSNGGSTSPALGVTAAVGDKIILETDPVAGTVKVYYWDASANAGAGGLLNSGNPLATVTLTGLYIPASYYVFAGGNDGTNAGPTTANSDSMTLNAGALPFSMAPTAGYGGW